MSNKPEDSALPEKADEVGADSNARAAADVAADIAADLQADDAGTEEAEEEVEEHDPLAEAQAEIADLKDKLLRAMAEMENIRRRSEKEKTELGKYAVTNFARDMLSVADNMDRALAAAEAGGDDSGEAALTQLLDGVRLTQKDLLHQFEKHGIREINPIGEKLDPNWHQAMVQLDDPEAPAGTIVQVMQVGYAIEDRLLRAAMVAVAKGGGNGQGAGGGEKGANVDTTA